MRTKKDKAELQSRTCKDCYKYPCFVGINNCQTDFAKQGCLLYRLNEHHNDEGKISS